jgi:pimeloyl-ACP methyl ester carboxylesterase
MPEFTEHHAEAGGRAVRYAEAGAGDPLIVLPGEDGRPPSAALGVLAGGRRVIAVSGRADSGPADGGPADGGARELAETTAALATALGLGTFDLLAAAAGGAAACWLAVIAPDRVRALVLEAPAAPGGDLAAALGESRVPALVLHGTRDEQSPAGEGAAYQRLMPNAFFSYVYGAGHDIQGDRPRAFAGLVTDFLARRGGFLVHDGGPLASD